MKVYIGPYRNYIGPYQIAEFLFFWKKHDRYSDNEDIIDRFGHWLATDKNGNQSRLSKFCQWLNNKKKRKVSVKIHNYDTWSMDHTLAIITLPMLKMLKEEKYGSPFVDDEDVSEELRNVPEKTNENDIREFDDKRMHERWEYVLNEMIFAFEKTLDDNWYDEYYKEDENGVFSADSDKILEVEQRIANGFALFGKYYQNLWT